MDMAIKDVKVSYDVSKKPTHWEMICAAVNQSNQLVPVLIAISVESKILEIIVKEHGNIEWQYTIALEKRGSITIPVDTRQYIESLKTEKTTLIINFVRENY